MKAAAIVGRSNTGKTRLVTALIAEMKARGLRVIGVKRCHGGFSLDTEGKDSADFARAGASGVGLVSSEGWAFMGGSTIDLRTAVEALFPDADVLLIEGGKSEPGPMKIEVLRRGVSEGPVVPRRGLAAIVADFDVQAPPGVPVFGPDSAAAICDHILSRKEEAMREVGLEVDGKEVPLNPFVRKFIESTVLGMVQALDGVPGAPRSVVVRIGDEAGKEQKG